MVEEVEVLKDHADLRAKGAEGAPVGDIKRATFQEDLAFVRGDEAVDALKQGAFAGPGRADEYFQLAPVQRQGAILQDGLSAEFFGKVGHLQDRACAGFLGKLGNCFAHAYPAAPMPIVPPVE